MFLEQDGHALTKEMIRTQTLGAQRFAENLGKLLDKFK
jgi:hypothetical protein